MAEDEKDLGEREKAPHRRRLPARVPIDCILKGSKEIIIVHNGEDYRLRVTARGKLILTK
jgi:hemin uptake protein HemP